VLELDGEDLIDLPLTTRKDELQAIISDSDDRPALFHVRGWEKTSDHAPVWVELADKPKRRRKPAAATGAKVQG
jgi:ATP-dependent DNA ligase